MEDFSPGASPRVPSVGRLSPGPPHTASGINNELKPIQQPKRKKTALLKKTAVALRS
jgi:hypothetical protein